MTIEIWTHEVGNGHTLMLDKKFQDTKGVIMSQNKGQTIQLAKEKGPTIIYKALHRQREPH